MNLCLFFIEFKSWSINWKKCLFYGLLLYLYIGCNLLFPFNIILIKNNDLMQLNFLKYKYKNNNINL